MKFTIIAFFSLLSIQTFADVGDGKLLSCGKSFSIYKTAAVQYFQGQLTVGKSTVALDCVKEAEQNTNVRVLWNCTEDRAGEGRYLVNVQTGGFAGTIKTAYVELEQMYPLEAAHIATLNCK